MDLQEALCQLGLKQNEAVIYLKLLELSWSQAGELSKETGINRVSTYDILERLCQKGLASMITQNGVRIYQVRSPTQLQELLKEQQQTLKSVMTTLEGKYRATRMREEVTTLKGRFAIKSLFSDMLKTKELGIIDPHYMMYKVIAHDFEQFRDQLKKKQVRAKMLILKKQALYDCSPFVVRLLPSTYTGAVTKILFDNNVAYVIWNELKVVIHVTSGQVFENEWSQFMHLWES